MKLSQRYNSPAMRSYKPKQHTTSTQERVEYFTLARSLSAVPRGTEQGQKAAKVTQATFKLKSRTSSMAPKIKKDPNADRPHSTSAAVEAKRTSEPMRNIPRDYAANSTKFQAHFATPVTNQSPSKAKKSNTIIRKKKKKRKQQQNALTTTLLEEDKMSEKDIKPSSETEGSHPNTVTEGFPSKPSIAWGSRQEDHSPYPQRKNEKLTEQQQQQQLELERCMSDESDEDGEDDLPHSRELIHRNVNQDCKPASALQESEEEYSTEIEEMSEEEAERSKSKFDGSGMDVYVSTCKKLGVVPISWMEKSLKNIAVTMKYHGIGSVGAIPLARALKENTRTDSLNLTGNHLRAHGGMMIALAVKENLYLTSVDLSDNFMGAVVGITFAKVLMTNPNIKIMKLKGNHFTDKVACAFAEMLKTNKTLEELDMSYNEMGERGGLYLGAGLGMNVGLKSLNLRWNSIFSKGAVSMAAALKTNKNLLKLDLSWNGLSYIGCLALGRHLKKNSTMTHLDVRLVSIQLETKESMRCFLLLDTMR